MQVAGRQEDRLARGQADAVEQQCRQHTGIAGIALAELQHGLGFGLEFRSARADVLDGTIQYRRNQHIDVGLGCGDPGGEQGAQAVGVGLIAEQFDERVEVRDLSLIHI